MQIDLVDILSVTVMVIYLQMGLFVVLKNPTASLNRYFFFMAMGYAFWSFGLAFFDPANDGFQSSLLLRFGVASSLIIYPFLIRFFTLLSDLPKNNNFKIWIFLVSLAISLTLLYFTVFNHENFNSLYFPQRTFGNFETSVFEKLIFVYYTAAIVAVFVILFYWRKKLETPGELIQFRFVLISMIIAVTFGIIFDFIVPMSLGKGFTQLAHVFSVFWLGGIAFGMLRIKLFALTPALAANQLLDHNKQILFFCEENGKVTRTNQFTGRLLNSTENEICEQFVFDFFVEIAEINKLFNQATVHGFSGPAELSIKSLQGEYIAVNISILLLKDRFNDVQGVVVLGQDYREAIRLRNEIVIRKQVEEKLQVLSEILETRVKERSNQLANSYRELQVKMTERLEVEERIKSDIVEKELIINEIHNRVKNNMTLIILLIENSVGKENPEKVNRKFLELAQRVRAILLVHHHLYLSMNYSEVDFSGFIQLLVGQISELYKPKYEVKFDMKLSEGFLDMKQAIPLGIIVNEIISNSYSHAFGLTNAKPVREPKLSLEFRQVDGFCHLTISDNGKGLPKKFDIENTQTNGLPLVQVLVNDQINGTFEIASEGGTTVKIVFPVLENNIAL